MKITYIGLTLSGGKIFVCCIEALTKDHGLITILSGV